MKSVFRKTLASPVFADDDKKSRSASFINLLALGGVPILVLLISARTLAGTGALLGTTNLILAAVIFILIIAWFVMRLGWITLAGHSQLLSIWLATTLLALTGGGIGGNIFLGYFLVLLLAGLLLGWRPAVGYTLASILALFTLAGEESLGTVIEGSILFALGAFFLYLIINGLENEIGRAKTDAGMLWKRIQQLLEYRDALKNQEEERTAVLGKRAAQLEAIAEFAQSIAQLENPDKIFAATTNLISERFGYYHVGIFLIDRHREFAVLQAANSAGGKKMVERGHRLRLGTGIVGFAAQTSKPRLALNVGEDAVFFNNPDLPHTRSEVAVPLKYGDSLIGVLDVQSTEVSAFSEDDFQVLGTLANQLAIAIENARLLAEARTAASQVQEVYNEFVRTQWTRTGERLDYAGYRYNAGRIEILESPNNADAAPNSGTSSQTGDSTRPPEPRRGRIAVPVRLRGEVIGMLNVESNDPTKSWRTDEISLMEAVAERAALAMENARLFQDARRRAAKERMIAEATSHISSSMNIENILEATATELERVLGGSEVLIRFASKDSP